MSNKYWTQDEEYSESSSFNETVDSEELKRAEMELDAFEKGIELPPQAKKESKHTPKKFIEEQEQEEEHTEEFNLSDEDPLSDETFLRDARLRLEMGRLYDMLLSHDLFGDVDADSRAIQQIQKEIRQFIKDRMEIMLGLKEPKMQTTLGVALPFNNLEIQVLKSLAATASKGATQEIEEPAIASTTQVVQKSNSLKKLSVQAKNTNIKPVAQKSIPSTPRNNDKALEARAALEEKRQRAKVAASQRSSASVPERTPLTKPPSEMTAKELRERNEIIKAEQAKKKVYSATASRIPMPSAQEQAIKYLSTNSQSANLAAGLLANSGKVISQVETLTESDMY